MPKNISLPDWEQVLSAAARLQQLLPKAVLVGGTASAIHARHRFSRDADHVLPDLRGHFDEILAQLESVAGWKTVKAACNHCATTIFDRVAALEQKRRPSSNFRRH
jgi:hypothetical protein